MIQTSFRSVLPLLLVMAMTNIAWISPEVILPYEIYNESGQLFDLEPVKAKESFTVQLTSDTRATLSIYDCHGSLMARRVLNPEWERTSTLVNVRRWPKGRYEMVVQTAEEVQQYPLTIE